MSYDPTLQQAQQFLLRNDGASLRVSGKWAKKRAFYIECLAVIVQQKEYRFAEYKNYEHKNKYDELRNGTRDGGIKALGGPVPESWRDSVYTGQPSNSNSV